MPVWANALAEAAAEARLLTQGVVATATSHLLALMFRRQVASTKNKKHKQGGMFRAWNIMGTWNCRTPAKPPSRITWNRTQRGRPRLLCAEP